MHEAVGRANGRGFSTRTFRCSDGAGSSRLDVAVPLPYLGCVRLETLDEAGDEVAQLDQGLIAHRVVEEEVGFRSPNRHEGHVGRRTPKDGVEVEHRSDGAGPREEPE